MWTTRLLAATLMAKTLMLAAASPDAIAGGDTRLAGNWSRTDGEASISISPCGERLCAVNTWIRDPSKGELVGDRFVMSVQPREPATLAGEALDVRRGQTYSVLISLGQDAMTTKGCLVAGLLCRTMSWVRTR